MIMKTTYLFKTLLVLIAISVSTNAFSQAEMISDIAPGSAGSLPDNMVIYNGKLLFIANDFVHGHEPWSCDGDTSILIGEIIPGTTGAGGFNEPTVYNGKVFFTSLVNNSNFDLWSWNGVSFEEELVTQYTNDIEGPKYLTIYDGKLFYQIDNPTVGVELASFNGLVETIETDINSSDNSHPENLYVFDGKLYFQAIDQTHGTEVWSYDGAAPELITDISYLLGEAEPSWFTEYNGKLFFQAVDGINGMELWRYDGDTTVMIADLNPGALGSDPKEMCVYDGKLYFQATDGVNGTELWSYNDTTLTLIEDIRPGNWGSNPRWLTVYNDKLFFSASNTTVGEELWSYDGDTVVVAANIAADIGGNFESSGPSRLIVYNGSLYFTADDQIHGAELWKYSEPNVCNAYFSLYPDPSVAQSWFAVNGSVGASPITYEWEWGDGNTSVGNNPSHVYSTAGYYNICVTMTDANSCSETFCDNSTNIYKTMDMITVNVVNELPIPTEIDEYVEEHYRVIPNPSSGQFVLSMNSIAERTRLDIFNSMGQLVVTKEYIDKQYLEFEILQPSGIYFAQILSSDNLPGYIRLVKQ